LEQKAKEQNLFIDTWRPFDKRPDTEAYLDYLMGVVEQYRKAGKSDTEILNMMK
jgi:hypothetical protein